jgi:hypothetical protein
LGEQETMRERSKANNKVGKAVFAIADHFLATNEMPEVGIHLARLQREGHSRDSAKAMIGTALLTSIYFAKKNGVPLDYPKVKRELARLPKLSSPLDARSVDIRDLV